MLIKQVNFTDFCDSFSDSYKNNYTHEGKRALFDYLEQLSEDTGDNIELDTIAICCEYSEYADVEEVQATYPDIKTIEELHEHTQVIEFDGGIIIQDF